MTIVSGTAQLLEADTGRVVTRLRSTDKWWNIASFNRDAGGALVADGRAVNTNGVIWMFQPLQLTTLRGHIDRIDMAACECGIRLRSVWSGR